MMTSTGSKEVCDPSELLTRTCGHSASAARASRASVASISIAVTLPVEPQVRRQRVVSSAAAGVKHLCAGHDVEVVEQIGVEARLPVVDAMRLIECDEDVVINMARVSIFG